MTQRVTFIIWNVEEKWQGGDIHCLSIDKELRLILWPLDKPVFEIRFFFSIVKNKTFLAWGKFDPTRVIQNGGVELSTQTSEVKNIIHESYPNKKLSKITRLI